MKDTSKYILKKQLEIIRSKSISQRVLMTTEMTQFVWDMAEHRIRKRQPQLNKREIVAERFKEIYAKDFSAEKLEEIARHLKEN